MISFQNIRSCIPILLPILFAIPIGWQGFGYFQRPARTAVQRSLHPGMTYDRIVWDQPRPVLLHVTTIDLTHPQLKILVTPHQPAADSFQLSAMTTSAFLAKHNLQFAVNASFFYPFREDSPWSYYPHPGDRVSAVGQTISNGHAYSAAREESGWAVICFNSQNLVQILPRSTCPPDTQQAVSGNELISLQPSAIAPSNAEDGDKPYARLIMAQEKTGQKLWAIAIDGKQPGYSEGIKLKEIVPFLQKLGADRAINLDGGGSTTMVTASEKGPQILNSPIHNKIPMTERPIANHIGFSIK